MSEPTPATEEREFNPAKYLIDFKGRAYLDVAHRLLWLNDQHERFEISTTLLHYGEDYAVVQATVVLYGDNDRGNPLRSATGLGQGRRQDMPSHISSRFVEKAETAAVGRALGMLGLGTLSAQEFDDSEHLADSPVEQGAAARSSDPDEDRIASSLLLCVQCRRPFKDKETANGFWAADKQYESAVRKYGKALCYPCSQKGA